MEITLAHHKDMDRKPKPYIKPSLAVLLTYLFSRTTFLFHEEALPILCPVSYILAIAIRDDAFELEGFHKAEPFFETNL